MANWEKGLGQPLVRYQPGIARLLGSDPEPEPRTLAGRLRSARFRLGLTQEQMAVKLGLDEGSVCRWERGSRRPTKWMAARLSALLDELERDGQLPEGLSTLSFFDLTRWRRRPPSELLLVYPATLGDRLRHRRLQLGLSQEEAGRRLGVGRATIYRWERGEDPPSRRLRAAIRRFLGRHSGRTRSC